MPAIHAYQQLEATDCGITCMRILAKYYGKDVPLQVLRDICDINRLGISIKNLVAGFGKIGMFAKGIKISLDELKEMPLPAILFWKQSHFVVLYKQQGDKFCIADPSIGKITIGTEEFKSAWCSDSTKSIAIVAAPNDDFCSIEFPKESCAHSLAKLCWNTFAKHSRRFATVILFALFVLCSEICMPLLFQRTVDDGINGGDINLVWLLIIGQFFVFIGNYVSNYVIELILAKLGIDISVTLLSNYLFKLAHMPISFFDKKVCSDLVQKADDHNRIKDFLVQFPQNMFITGLSVVVFSGLLVYESKVIFIIFLSFTALSIAWTLMFLRIRKSIDYAYVTYSGQNRNNLHELIYGMAEVKAHGAQQTRISAWHKIQEKVYALSYRLLYVSMLQSGGNLLFSRLKEIAITGICAACVINGEMTIGAMMTVSYIIGRLAQPFSNIISSLVGLQETSISYSRIKEIDGYEVRNSGADVVLEQPGDIIFDNVSFRYPGVDNYVIESANVRIPIGKTTAIVGESGCGKSTLLKLLLKFYNPTCGKILIGGQSLANIGEKEWIAHCGAVMQNGYVFSGSIAENIAIDHVRPNLEKVRQAAKIACLDKFVDALPMGYSTTIGTSGLELSGGQRQRLMIARAIYRNPEILILDEATSSLDANNEASILENLKRMWCGRTIIIIAHRLSTIRDTDQIIYMKNGSIAECGSHNELLLANGGYQSLVKHQVYTL